jgi:flavin-binding protein dodecin
MVMVKVIEVISTSSKGWNEAAENALKEAAKTVRNIRGMHIKRRTAKVKNNKIVEYRAVVKWPSW